MTTPRHRATGRAALVLGLAVALSLGACAGRRGGAAPPSRQRFEVSGHGELEIALPPGWKASSAEGEEPIALTVRLEPRDAKAGGGFMVLLTPFWNPPPTAEEAPASPEAFGADAQGDTAQLLAELARRKALATSVEQEIALHELRGERGVHGYWFAATDKAFAAREPGEGEWRHLLQGAAAVGDMILAFTLLDNAPGPQREAVLEVVRGARHVPASAGGSPAAPKSGAMRFTPDPEAETEPLSVAYPGRAFTVLVDLPGFEMFEPRPAEDGEGVLVLGRHPQSGLVASVTLRDAHGAADAGACRERILERIRKSAPDLRELALSDASGGARAAYVLDELRGRKIRQQHAHLFLWREGVCVNVQVSKADPEPEDTGRIDAILTSVRFGASL
ncbi:MULTISPECIES: hypothetical protein [unclassified Anaeromyxobacter]|uniref:hypothetical protein n=1 Tax=unclassified Anaeromyxobacter TaxID=2620896 RepID=UPI001F5992BB|nr:MULTISPECIES: hypothetical protein [unclassified Anaeromyxobacter]